MGWGTKRPLHLWRWTVDWFWWLQKHHQKGKSFSFCSSVFHSSLLLHPLLSIPQLILLIFSVKTSWDYLCSILSLPHLSLSLSYSSFLFHTYYVLPFLFVCPPIISLSLSLSLNIYNIYIYIYIYIYIINPFNKSDTSHE